MSGLGTRDEASYMVSFCLSCCSLVRSLARCTSSRCFALSRRQQAGGPLPNMRVQRTRALLPAVARPVRQRGIMIRLESLQDAGGTVVLIHGRDAAAFDAVMSSFRSLAGEVV